MRLVLVWRRKLGLKVFPNEAGFMLMEVLIALLILGIVLIPLLGVFGWGLKMGTGGKEGIVALNLAREKLEEIKSAPGTAEEIIAQYDTKGQEVSFADYPGYTYKIAITEDEDLPLLTVTVEVFFQGQKVVSLTGEKEASS